MVINIPDYFSQSVSNYLAADVPVVPLHVLLLHDIAGDGGAAVVLGRRSWERTGL